MSDILQTPNNYSSLSVKDLLQARDLYHFHLINKTNVVGTAVGRYLIRKSDPYPQKGAKSKGEAATKRPKSTRTFENSEVRSYSWPCVLVLVKQWAEMKDFGSGHGQIHPDQMVPRSLYMPDGRTVPVCVVCVEQAQQDQALLPDWHWPSSTFGGGMPIVIESQGRDLYATVGCLVSDGQHVYALTSGHVCGDEGGAVYTIARGQRVLIGHATGERLTREQFQTLYPEFPGQRSFSRMDVGLIKLSNAEDWTSQTFGLTAPGPLANLNEWNISTRLIGAPVVAVGAASGRLEGRICALFYRYKTLGAYDYIADFLIAPREGSPRNTHTRPGDSGAVWHLVTQGEDVHSEEERDTKVNEFEGTMRPLAVEWGGQVFQGGRQQSTYALATSLTTVCQALDVEVMLEHNVGVAPYWGQVGHYTIASFACGLVQNAKLRNFINANLSQISFTMAELTADQIKDRLKDARDNGSIVPLADVPDIVWKQHYSKMTGGRDDKWAGLGRSTGPEHPTHYADIDEPRASDGKTLRQLCMSNPANVSIAFWQKFYDDMGHTNSRDRGLLPFRVWQFFTAMKKAAAARKPAEFLCAAGILSHYVGDACQPLHGSIYADGYKDRPTEITHHRRETGEEYTTASNEGAGVHSAYESKMIDRYAPDLVQAIQTKVSGLTNLTPPSSGQEAANATVALMDRSAKAIPPADLVDTYIEEGGTPKVAVLDALWEKYGDATAKVMADGARVLAAIWDGAWSAGGGNSITAGSLGTIAASKLQTLYEDENFVKSLDLDNVSSEL